MIYILYIVLSTFQWIPTKVDKRPKEDESKEDRDKREEFEEKISNKNKLVFLIIKVCLVLSVMLS